MLNDSLGDLTVLNGRMEGLILFIELVGNGEPDNIVVSHHRN